MTKYLLTILVALSAFRADAVQWGVNTPEGLKMVQAAYVDKMLRDIPKDKLAMALKYMAVRAVLMDNGEYAIHGHVRGDGGGPATAALFCWGTRLLGYGTLTAGVAGAAITAAPIIGSGLAAIGIGGSTAAAGTGVAVSGAVVAENAIAAAIPIAAAGPAGVGAAIGAGVAAAAPEAAVAAGTGVAVVAAETAATGGIIGFIEGMAAAAAVIGMSLPTP